MKFKLVAALCLMGFLGFAQLQQKNSMGRLLSKIQSKSPKDNPQSRWEFEVLKTADPKTGQIPPGIYQEEVIFYENNLRNGQNARVDNTLQWTNRGPFNVGGRTRALALDLDNENIILAGGVSGGMWRSTDGGQTWNKTTGSNEHQSVTAIAQDPRDSQRDTWYYTTGEFAGNSASGSGAFSFYYGNGVYKSVDNGQTWTILSSTITDQAIFNENSFDYNHEIVVSPTTGSIFVANYFGIYKSTDGGNSWAFSYDMSSDGWSDIVVDSQGNLFAFIVTEGVLYSEDDGLNWTNISGNNFPTLGPGDRGELAIAPSNENIVYLLSETSSSSSLYPTGHALLRYDKQTLNWDDRSDNLPQLGADEDSTFTGDFNSQGGYDLLVKVKPDDENFLIIGGRNLWRSTDGFATSSNTDWIGGYTPRNNSFALYPEHHPDQHSFVFYPSNPNRVISGNDGGLQSTDDIRVTENTTLPINWRPLNNGYLTTQVYAVSIGAEDQILAGFQDNGTWFTSSTSSTVNWVSPFGGDGAYSAFSNDGLTRFLSAQNAFIYRTTYSNANDPSPNQFFEYTPQSGYSTSLFITPFYLDPVDNDIFYLGGDTDLYVNTNALNGNTTNGWKSITISSDGVISEFGVIGNGSTYLGTSRGDFFKVENAKSGSPTVKNLTSNLFDGNYISGIAVNEENPDEVLVTVSNYQVQSIFYTSDGGNSWEHVSGNLEENEDGSGNGPSVRTTRIIGNGDLYIVGTSVGLFTTTTINGSATNWTQQDIDNLGAVVVEHVVTRNSDGLIVAGTHGNGVYTANVPVSSIDLALTSIDQPLSGRLGIEEIVITIDNLGSQSVSGFEVAYSINGELQQSEQITESIASGNSYQHTFTQSFDFTGIELATLSASVSISGDEKSENDSLEVEINNVVAIDVFPYEEGFESAENGWILNGIWERGSPSQSNLSNAASGVNAIMTDLDNNYPNNVNDAAETPVFDFSGLVLPIVEFDLSYKIENEYDGLVLAYRTDLNQTFSIIDTSKAISNWYNAIADVYGGELAWTGSDSTDGYLRASADLSFLAGESIVQLAFFFASDFSITDEGAAIDNFVIRDDQPADGEIILSANTVLENDNSDPIVGNLEYTDVSSPDFSLVAGFGDEDNTKFQIQNDTLRLIEAVDFELQNTLNIRVEASAASAETIVQIFAIGVLDRNDPPTDVSLSNSSISENSSIPSFVGFFVTQDQDENDFFSYELMNGTDQFSISSDTLFSIDSVDFETNANLSVGVRVTDSAGSTLEQDLIIEVLDSNDPPTDLTLDNLVIQSDVSSGDVIGNFAAIDQDEDELEYFLIDGEGSDDNVSFSISGSSLAAEGLVISSSEDIFRILVEASDARGGFTVEAFTLSVEELLGLVNLAKRGISIFPNPVEDQLNIKIDNTYRQNYEVNIYSLNGKKVYNNEFKKTNEVHKIKLDISHLTTGTYTIEFSTDQSKSSGKLIIR